MGCFVSCDFFSSLDAQNHWSESGVCTTHFVTSEPFKSGQKHNGVFLWWDAQDVSMCGDGGGIGQHSGLVAGISAQDLVALGAFRHCTVHGFTFFETWTSEGGDTQRCDSPCPDCTVRMIVGTFGTGIRMCWREDDDWLGGLTIKAPQHHDPEPERFSLFLRSRSKQEQSIKVGVEKEVGITINNNMGIRPLKLLNNCSALVSFLLVSLPRTAFDYRSLARDFCVYTRIYIYIYVYLYLYIYIIYTHTYIYIFTHYILTVEC